MIRAVQIVRSPLERLYDSLSDEQRRQFNAMGNSSKGEREPGSAPSGGDLTTFCDQQAGGGFAKLPVQRIEQVVRPNTQQQNALGDLKKASEDAASLPDSNAANTGGAARCSSRRSQDGE
jgi:hypothetical protein